LETLQLATSEVRRSIHFLNFFYCENREEKLHSNISPKYFKVERLSNLKKKKEAI